MTAHPPNGRLMANNPDVLRQFPCVLLPCSAAGLFIRLRHFKCHLSLACAIFLQDLDPCLAYKASSGYLLSFVLNIPDEKRQEVKKLIELKYRPRSMSRNLSTFK